VRRIGQTIGNLGNYGKHVESSTFSIEVDMATPILEVRDLEKSYGHVKAVDGLDFDLYPGEVLTLLGPSGCGKSTTLRLIAGLEEPDRGEIRIRGRLVASPSKRVFVAAEKRNLGLVFQSYAIWPHLTVEQNVAYPLEIRGLSKNDIKHRVANVLELVGLGGLAGRPATHLSGGQQQRVALARALVYEPDLLLLDEPLSNLDAKLRAEMRLQLKALQQRLGTTILYVTHDQLEAMALSDRVAVIHHGRIEQIGPPSEIYEAPATYFVQSFIGRTLTFPGIIRFCNGSPYIELDNGDSLMIDASTVLPEGSRALLTIRPEDINIEPLSDVLSPGNYLRARVDALVYFGDHFECILRVGEIQWVLDVPKDCKVQQGQELMLRFHPAKVKVWPV